VSAVLDVRSATVGYADQPVLHEVSLQVRPGEMVAVLGANGSGKTTLLRGVLGLARLMSGEIRLLGEPAAQLRQRARIGYVPQRLSAGGGIPGTVREVVTPGRLARLGLLSRPGRADREAVQRAIATVNLTDRADSGLATLSGGQQRRALIARALAAEPELLLMDEPLAGVDQASQQTLARTVGTLERLGVTVLVVTHQAGPLLGVLSRAVVLDAGRVGYDGPLLPGMLGVSDGVLPRVS
jgi:zinc transport system ATP-binding protein